MLVLKWISPPFYGVKNTLFWPNTHLFWPKKGIFEHFWHWTPKIVHYVKKIFWCMGFQFIISLGFDGEVPKVLKNAFFGQNKWVFGQKRVFLTPQKGGETNFKTSMQVFYQDMSFFWGKKSILHIKLWFLTIWPFWRIWGQLWQVGSRKMVTMSIFDDLGAH